MVGAFRATAVRIQNVSVTFGAVTAVDEVSLDVQAGEVFGILGPSGSGKSTLLRVVAGLMAPDRGSVRFDGADVTHRRPDERNIGLMFQDHALFPHMTVHDNVAFGLRMARQSATTIDQRVSEVLDLIGLADFGPRDVATLSGGEQQRVALARAVARAPALLMFDEPLASLDRALHRQLTQAVQDLVRTTGCTALYVTHDQEEAFTVCDRIAIMRAGRVVQTGSPQALVTCPNDAFVADFIGHDNLFAAELSGTEVSSALGSWQCAGLHVPGADGAYVLVVPGYAITLHADDAELSPRTAAPTVEMMATIVRRQLYTHQQVYTVRTAAGEELVARQLTPTLHELGAPVIVRITVSACIIVETDGASGLHRP